MSREVRISCDHCNEDITSAGSMPTFRLRLVAEALPHASKIVNAVLVQPPIKEDKYFCDFICLGEWLRKDQMYRRK